MSARNVVFVSHANPEDNRFARWITLRLAREGYQAWCDLTRLLGGEDFWKEIEKTLRTRTAKFVYVLSRASNSKEGPLNELAMAKQVAKSEKLDDFVIPVLIDALPHSDINIELKRINAIDFAHGWAGGLTQLLHKLDATPIPRNPSAGPVLVNQWWKTARSGQSSVNATEDVHDSNRFPLSIPSTLYVHTLLSAPNELKIGGDHP
ncbi:MAG: toll/interleukin-1 receptor domain-containing protein, partial [Burkholderiales bacterium]